MHIFFECLFYKTCAKRLSNIFLCYFQDRRVVDLPFQPIKDNENFCMIMQKARKTVAVFEGAILRSGSRFKLITFFSTDMVHNQQWQTRLEINQLIFSKL